MSDTELWQAWRERGDAEAFTTLVERHLDMVYATARRILRNSHDAEDVAQDCFVTLLKGRVRVRGSLGPWLHRVARHRSLDKIKGEVRRRGREHVYHDGQADADEAALDDTLAHIDAAIDALPADLREAVVGRFLEGKTNQALGAALGVGESTIRFRVTKGVDAIRARLEKNGVVLPVAALAAVLESNLACAAPGALRQPIVKLALGVPTLRRATRLYSGPKVLAGFGVALLFVCVGGLVVSSGALRRSVADIGMASEGGAMVTVATTPLDTSEVVAPADAVLAVAERPKAEALLAGDLEAAAPEALEPMSTVSGTIYDDDGYPLAGAIVTVASNLSPYGFEGMQVSSAATGEDGRYSVEEIRHHKIYQGYTTTCGPDEPPAHSGLITFESPTLYGVVHVYVTAEGFITTGKQHHVEPGSHKEGVDYTLAPGVTMRGRVLWPDGRAAAGAGIGQRFFTALRNSSMRSANGYASTTADGYFQLGVESAGEVALMVVAANGHQAFFNRVPANTSEIPTLTLSPMAALSGKITLADGSPLAEAFITLTGRFGVTEKPDFASHVESSNAFEIGNAFIQDTYTDHQGRFAFSSLAAVPDAVLKVSGPGSGAGPSTRLLIRHMGALEAGMRKSVEIVLPGHGEQMFIVADIRGVISGESFASSGVTLQRVGSEGRIRLRQRPGEAPGALERSLTIPGEYRIWPHYGYMDLGAEAEAYAQRFTWKAGEKLRFEFVLPDPFAQSIRLLDPEGYPVVDAALDLVNGGTIFDSGKTDGEGRYSWDGFAPGYPAFFKIAKAGYSTTETMAVAGEAGAEYPEQTVTLYPAGGVEGWVVDGDGQPIANAEVHVSFEADEATWISQQESTGRKSIRTQTDSDGAFVWLEGVPAVPGRVTVSFGEGAHGSQVSAGVSVEGQAGFVLNLGELALPGA